jgi:hypothetical protein
MHSPPQFYDVDCQQVAPELDYIESITKTYIVNGEVRTTKVITNNHITDEGDWMVACPRQSIALMRALNIHPFKTKGEARQFAVKNKLKSYRYLKVQ